jgi:hypothetical protein
VCGFRGYGLLTILIAIRPEPGKHVPASALAPEPLDLWRREIRELKALGDLWDWTSAGDQ